MTSLAISSFAKNDVKEIADVMKNAFNSVDQGWTDGSSLAYINEYFDKSANFVAKIDTRIVGFVVADKRSDHLFIDAIGVLSSEMGKGIAKELWREIVNYCKQNQVTKIKMIADPNSIAYKWYKKLNFKETGWVELDLEL